MSPVLADDELRELLEPLAAHQPAALDVARLREQAAGARRRRRTRRASAVAVAALATLAVALLPAPDEPRRSPEDGVDVLRSAAAVAAAQPDPPIAGARFRYARVRAQFTYEAREDGRVARDNYERTEETWVGARWKGRVIARAGRRWQTGDRDLARAAFGAGPTPLIEASDAPFAYGDGPLARLDPSTLPDDRARIARVLNRGIRTDRWGPYASSRGRPTGIPEHVQRSHTAYSMVLLLVYARLTADQRAALLDVLATHAAARDLGPVEDAIGRRGHAVRLDFPPPTPYSTPAPAEQISLVFDPVTSEILEWSMTPPDGPSRSGPGPPRDRAGDRLGSTRRRPAVNGEHDALSSIETCAAGVGGRDNADVVAFIRDARGEARDLRAAREALADAQAAHV